MTDEYSVRFRKITSGMSVFVFLIIRLSFTNTQVLPSNFDASESFFESNSPDIFALCWANSDHSLDSSNFSVMVIFLKFENILLLICMVLQLIWRRDVLLGVTSPFKTLRILICFLLVLLFSVSYCLTLYQSSFFWAYRLGHKWRAIVARLIFDN